MVNSSMLTQCTVTDASRDRFVRGYCFSSFCLFAKMEFLCTIYFEPVDLQILTKPAYTHFWRHGKR